MTTIDHTETKPKKGRPRKEPIELKENEGVEQPEKKKRGRKKKQAVEEEKKPKKKRGRKAAVKYFSSSIRKKIPLSTAFQDQDNYILHIDIKDKDVEKSDTSSMLYTEDPKAIIDAVFTQLQDETQENSILLSTTDTIPTEDDIKQLYQLKLQSRDEQDKLLVDKLETLHQDDTFFETLEKGLENQVRMRDAKQQPTKNPPTQETNRKKGYFQILHDFVLNKEWLDHTDICCWWCCHQFDTVPIGLPVDYDIKQGKFRVKGVFCSFACMTTYKDECCKHVHEHLIKYLHSKLTATPLDTVIDRAPPRQALKMFGGELSIDEFRSSTKAHKIYKMIEYPMFVSKDYVEEIDIANVRIANEKVFDDTLYAMNDTNNKKRVQDAKQRLKTQIDKTTVTIGNTIDKFIMFS